MLSLLYKDGKMPKVTRNSVAKSKVPTKSRPNSGTEAKKARKAKAVAGRNAPVFFQAVENSGEWGFLSPWWSCEFEVKGVAYQSAGQYILAEKARAFGDKKMLQKILEEVTPEILQSFGDTIQGLDQRSWRRRVTRIAKMANMAKFTSDDTESRALLNQFKKLKNRELVFADPSDAVLGIGLSIDEAKEMNREQWGANVFGKSFDAVRNHVKETSRTTKMTKKQKITQPYDSFDSSIFDVGGRMSIYW